MHPHTLSHAPPHTDPFTPWSCSCGWGLGGSPESVRSSLANFRHQPWAIFWARSKGHLCSSPLSTRWLFATLTSVLKLLPESPPALAQPIVTHWLSPSQRRQESEADSLSRAGQVRKPPDHSSFLPKPAAHLSPPHSGPTRWTTLLPRSCVLTPTSIQDPSSLCG